MLKLTQEDTFQGLSFGGRRRYENGEGLLVDIKTVKHERKPNDLMTIWVKEGYLPEFLETTLHVDTEYTTKGEDGWDICTGNTFNPYIKYRDGRPVVNFDWVLEATPENEQRIIKEIERRYAEGIRHEEA